MACYVDLWEYLNVHHYIDVMLDHERFDGCRPCSNYVIIVMHEHKVLVGAGLVPTISSMYCMNIRLRLDRSRPSSNYVTNVMHEHEGFDWRRPCSNNVMTNQTRISQTWLDS